MVRKELSQDEEIRVPGVSPKCVLWGKMSATQSIVPGFSQVNRPSWDIVCSLQEQMLPSALQLGLLMTEKVLKQRKY